MQVLEALSIEGTSRFAVLCYGVFRIHEQNAAFELMHHNSEPDNSRVHLLLNEEWPNGILLIETWVENEIDIQSTIVSSMNKMFDSGSCMAAICMYDGAFSSYDDIFCPRIASQIYAFCMSKGKYVISLDTDLLYSMEWHSIISRFRKRIE